MVTKYMIELAEKKTQNEADISSFCFDAIWISNKKCKKKFFTRILKRDKEVFEDCMDVMFNLNLANSRLSSKKQP